MRVWVVACSTRPCLGRRLATAWGLLPRLVLDRFHELVSLVSAHHNYREYRKVNNGVDGRGCGPCSCPASDGVRGVPQALLRTPQDAPVLPAVTVSLKDLVAATSVEVDFGAPPPGAASPSTQHSSATMCSACGARIVTPGDTAEAARRKQMAAGGSEPMRPALWTQVRCVNVSCCHGSGSTPVCYRFVRTPQVVYVARQLLRCREVPYRRSPQVRCCLLVCRCFACCARAAHQRASLTWTSTCTCATPRSGVA